MSRFMAKTAEGVGYFVFKRAEPRQPYSGTKNNPFSGYISFNKSLSQIAGKPLKEWDENVKIFPYKKENKWGYVSTDYSRFEVYHWTKIYKIIRVDFNTMEMKEVKEC